MVTKTSGSGPLTFREIHGNRGNRVASQDRRDGLPTPAEYFSAKKWALRKQQAVQLVQNSVAVLQSSAAALLNTAGRVAQLLPASLLRLAASI